MNNIIPDTSIVLKKFELKILRYKVLKQLLRLMFFKTKNPFKVLSLLKEVKKKIQINYWR